MTVLAVDTPAVVGEFDRPRRGYRYVAIDLRVKNIGRKVLAENMHNDSMLIYSGHRQTSAGIVSGGPCAEFVEVRIAPRDYRRGCVVFEIPRGMFPKVFQFTLNSGFADETGEWRL